MSELELDFGECDTCGRSPRDEGHGPGCARKALRALEPGFVCTPRPTTGERHVECRTCARTWLLEAGPTVRSAYVLQLLDHEAGHS